MHVLNGETDLDEEKNKWWKTCGAAGRAVRKVLGAAGFIMMPAVSFVLFETVTGNLTGIAPLMVRFNLLWYYAVYLLLFGITGTSRLTVPAASGFFYALSLAEVFVMEYRGTPILPADILAAGTAATVMGNYRLELTGQMQRCGWILLALNLFLLLAPVRVRGWKQRLGAFAGCAGGAACLGLYFYLSILPGYQLTMNLWDLSASYTVKGYVLTTAVSMQYIVKKPPKGYSMAALENLYARLASGETESAEGIQPVNVICIMNESLSDLRAAGEFTVSEEYFPFMDSLTENTVKGNLAVPVFGSGTSSSEYEFLTGNSMALLPVGTNPYQFYVPEGTPTLVSTMKAQGYRTVAMHPYPGENWNRDESYENMGFDEFLYGDYFDNLETFRTFISDRADYQKVIEQVENKKSPQEKLFIFNVTMQNHGGYEIEDPYFEEHARVRLTGELEGKYPMADQYLSLMKLSDEALEYLLGYFSQCDQPTMVVLFGDHQPSVEDAFWDEIAGCPSDQVSMEDHLMWYKTPFLIWTNYRQESENLGDLGAIYLSSVMLERANLELTPYNRFLLEMSKVLPVVHKLGFYAAEGSHYEWLEGPTEACPYQEMILEYQYMEYNHSLDKKTMYKLFEIPGS